MSLTIERPTLVDVQDFQQREPPATGGKPLFGEDGPSFGDFLDVINPLQHLPLVGTIYRALTGDELSDGARLAGGALFGGPVGLVAAMANLGLREATGRDLGGLALAAVSGGEAPAPAQDAPVQVAARDPAPDELAALAPGPAPEAAATETAAISATPQLSPEAFDALLRSVNRPSAQAQAAAPKAARWPAAWSRPNPLGAAPVAMPPAAHAATGARQASLELHDALRVYAQQKALAPFR